MTLHSKADYLRRLSELELADLRSEADPRMARSLKQPQVDRAFQAYRSATEHSFDKLPETHRALVRRVAALACPPVAAGLTPL